MVLSRKIFVYFCIILFSSSILLAQATALKGVAELKQSDCDLKHAFFTKSGSLVCLGVNGVVAFDQEGHRYETKVKIDDLIHQGGWDFQNQVTPLGLTKDEYFALDLSVWGHGWGTMHYILLYDDKGTLMHRSNTIHSVVERVLQKGEEGMYPAGDGGPRVYIGAGEEAPVHTGDLEKEIAKLGIRPIFSIYDQPIKFKKGTILSKTDSLTLSFQPDEGHAINRTLDVPPVTTGAGISRETSGGIIQRDRPYSISQMIMSQDGTRAAVFDSSGQLYVYTPDGTLISRQQISGPLSQGWTGNNWIGGDEVSISVLGDSGFAFLVTDFQKPTYRNDGGPSPRAVTYGAINKTGSISVKEALGDAYISALNDGTAYTASADGNVTISSIDAGDKLTQQKLPIPGGSYSKVIRIDPSAKKMLVGYGESDKVLIVTISD